MQVSSVFANAVICLRDRLIHRYKGGKTKWPGRFLRCTSRSGVPDQEDFHVNLWLELSSRLPGVL